MIGAKKMLRKKKKAQKIDVNPVHDPASTPDPLSMYEVTGDNPKIDPIIVDRASAANAQRLLGKPPSSSTKPMDDARAKSVPEVSKKSTYKNVIKATPTSRDLRRHYAQVREQKAVFAEETCRCSSRL